jgi:hypothetical protein
MQGNRVNNQDINVDVEVTGSFAEALRKMSKRMSNEVLVKAAKAGATVVAASIGERVPVKKGLLREELGVEISVMKQAVTATVGFLDEFQASIAYWVEHGHNNRVAKTAMQRFFKARHGDTLGMVPAHPFFRPGIDASLKDASRAVMDVLTQALQSDDGKSSSEVAA